MNLYYFKEAKRWVDLDYIQEVNYPQSYDLTGPHFFRYRLIFQEKDSEIFGSGYDSLGCVIPLENFTKTVYEPFLEAWKNKDKKPRKEVLPMPFRMM